MVPAVDLLNLIKAAVESSPPSPTGSQEGIPRKGRRNPNIRCDQNPTQIGMLL